VTDVRELLELAAGDEAGEPPVARIVAAGRRRARRRTVAVTGGAAAVTAVLAGMLLVPPPTPTAGVPAMTFPTATAAAPPCAVTVDRDRLPGRPVSAGDGYPTSAAADVLRLHGWPRAVPYDLARWTVVTDGNTGVLVAWDAGRPVRYIPIVRIGGTWTTDGPPCTP
jgi:hypothetical protein